MSTPETPAEDRSFTSREAGSAPCCCTGWAARRSRCATWRWAWRAPASPCRVRSWPATAAASRSCGDSRWQDWYASAEAALDRLRRRCDVVVVGGLSMGAVLALLLAAERKGDVAGAAVYAPTLRLDGWGVPWYARFFQLVPHKAIANWFDFTEREPYGVKDPRVRALVAAAIESGDSAKAGMLTVPGGAMFEFRGLVDAVRRRVPGIRQPVLLVHPREDDRANIANSFWLQRNLAGHRQHGRAQRQLSRRHDGPAAPDRGRPHGCVRGVHRP